MRLAASPWALDIMDTQQCAMSYSAATAKPLQPHAASPYAPDLLLPALPPAPQVPAFLEIVDIAGLVKGAANGEGLGNAFLSHIAGVDGIFHVCRAFEVRGCRLSPSCATFMLHVPLSTHTAVEMTSRLRDFAWHSIGRNL